MRKGMKTEKRIPHSSLCKKMQFEVPTTWKELSQEQLRYVVRLLWLYSEAPDWENRVLMASMLYFCNIEVVRKTSSGWLCRKRDNNDSFLLNTDLLPSMMKDIRFLVRPEEMDVRIGKVGKYEAVDFELQELMFGKYLEAENYYQAFLLSHDSKRLEALARILYKVPEGENPAELCDEILTGTFLWFAAVKNVLAREFPHFLKPAVGAGKEITRETLVANMRAQIRLLTKGDVTKQDDILKHTDTWTALAELDALAEEAEQIKKKYGK